MAVVERTVDIIGDDAFCSLILKRIVPDGMPVDFYDDVLTKLRPHALRNMSGLESVYFPNVTTVGKYAFAECPDLKKVEMPQATSVPERCMFSCSSLVEVIFPAATFIGEFCITGRSIKRIELPNVNTAGGTLQFYNSTALEEVILPKLGYIPPNMLSGCTALKQLDLPSAKTISATILNGATAMEVLNIGPGVTSINSNAFGGTPDGMIINLPIEEGAISGAPWGATNAIINYDTPYAGTVPIPES